jgi:hypothetical protein
LEFGAPQGNDVPALAIAALIGLASHFTNRKAGTLAGTIPFFLIFPSAGVAQW